MRMISERNKSRKFGTGKRARLAAIGTILAAMLAACGSGSGPQGAATDADGAAWSLTSQKSAPTQKRSVKTDLLIYAGGSSATGGPEALAAIADQNGWTHDEVTAPELDAMSLEEIASYGAIVWPGGYAGQMSGRLTAETRGRIRRAVRERGVGFAGFCAGAFIAISPKAESGEAGPAWGFALIDAPTLDYYYLEGAGVGSSMVSTKFADGETRSLVWWGGPKLPEIQGGVIARYVKTGEPAIAQTWAGAGLVVLAGPHPEAPQSWRTKLSLDDSDGMDQSRAAAMIRAALEQKPLRAD